MRCKCPICGQWGDYPQKYANKWHKCKMGCRATGTRLKLVPEGVGILEGDLETLWRRAIWRGKALRWVVALALASLAAAPFLREQIPSSVPDQGLWGAAGAGLVLAALSARAALKFWIARPGGL